MTDELRFRRDKGSGVYWAYGEEYGYSLTRDGREWRIDVREIRDTAGVRHTLGQPVLWWASGRLAETLALAKEIVGRFDADPAHDITDAICDTYAREHAERLQELEAALATS